MLRYEVDDAAALIELTCDGRVDKAEFEAAIAAMESLIERKGRIHVVEVIRDFSGIDPSLWWRDIGWSFSHLEAFGRCAVVTDSSWITPVARMVGALMPTRVEAFRLDQLDLARAWVCEEALAA